MHAYYGARVRRAARRRALPGRHLRGAGAVLRVRRVGALDALLRPRRRARPRPLAGGHDPRRRDAAPLIRRRALRALTGARPLQPSADDLATHDQGRRRNCPLRRARRSASDTTWSFAASSEEASIFRAAMYRLKSSRLPAAVRKKLQAAVGVRRAPKPVFSARGKVRAHAGDVHPLPAQAARGRHLCFRDQAPRRDEPGTPIGAPLQAVRRCAGEAERCMRDPRVERLAELITGYSLGIREGQVMRIDGEESTMPLVAAIYRWAIRRGALPYVPGHVRRASRRSCSRRGATSSWRTSPRASGPRPRRSMPGPRSGRLPTRAG